MDVPLGQGTWADLDVVTAIIRDVVRREILPRFGTLRDQDVKEKAGPLDLVTAADIAAEDALARRLLELDGTSVVVGEEAAEARPHLLGCIAGDRSVWVVDPIDGTANFARGRPGFVTIVALVRHGQTVAGWIHDPLAGTTLAAVRGRGAWSGSRRLRTAPSPPRAAMNGSAYGDVSSGVSVAQRLADTCGIVGVSSIPSSGCEYVGIALAKRHFMVSGRSLPWDHAAGALIVQEAGGTVAFLDGSLYEPVVHDRRILAASDEVTWAKLQAALCAPQLR